MCPSYLDGDHAIAREAPATVIPVRTARAIAVLRWHDCAVFKVREEAPARTGPPVSQNSTACRRPRERAARLRQVRSTLLGAGAELERAAVCATLAAPGAPILELP